MTHKIVDLKEYKRKKKEWGGELDHYFKAMLISHHPKESLYRAYVSEPQGQLDWVYKVMSKLTPQGHIMYVFYEQYSDEDVDSPWYGERMKDMIHADVVYSKSIFYRRLKRLKEVYKIKDFACFNLGRIDL